MYVKFVVESMYNSYREENVEFEIRFFFIKPDPVKIALYFNFKNL